MVVSYHAFLEPLCRVLRGIPADEAPEALVGVHDALPQAKLPRSCQALPVQQFPVSCRVGCVLHALQLVPQLRCLRVPAQRKARLTPISEIGSQFQVKVCCMPFSWSLSCAASAYLHSVPPVLPKSSLEGSHRVTMGLEVSCGHLSWSLSSAASANPHRASAMPPQGCMSQDVATSQRIQI